MSFRPPSPHPFLSPTSSSTSELQKLYWETETLTSASSSVWQSIKQMDGLDEVLKKIPRCREFTQGQQHVCCRGNQIFLIFGICGTLLRFSIKMHLITGAYKAAYD